MPHTYIVPTFHEEPPYLLGVHVARWGATELFHDLCLGPIHLDVRRSRAGSRIVGVRGADVGDFEHHVRRAVFAPERDAHVLHAVPWGSSPSQRWMSRVKKGKLGWIAYG